MGDDGLVQPGSEGDGQTQRSPDSLDPMGSKRAIRYWGEGAMAGAWEAKRKTHMLLNRTRRQHQQRPAV